MKAFQLGDVGKAKKRKPSGRNITEKQPKKAKKREQLYKGTPKSRDTA